MAWNIHTHLDFTMDYIVDHQTGDTLYNVPAFEWLLKPGAEENTMDQVLESYQRVKWKEVRSKRNRMLSETDWYVIREKERGIPVPNEIKNYRQNLRDITNNCDDVDDVVWPQKPEI